jgi:hypothetical protein
MKQVFNPIFTLLFVCFASFQVLAQDNQVSLNWNKSMPVPGNSAKPASIPVFEGAFVDFRARLPYYQFQIPGVEVGKFSLQQAVYAPLTAEEAKFLNKETIKTAAPVTVSPGTANGKVISTIRVLPLRVNAQNGQLEKLQSFNYTYTTQSTLKKTRSTNARTYASNSVLSSGDWFKIGVTSTGMYKLDRAELQKMGVNLQNLDPRRIQIYGNGGGMLPQDNAAPRTDDLVQNAIMVTGEADGSFDASDYVLFYAQGPHTWEADKQTQRFKHAFNIYTDTTFYFLTVGPANGKRVVQTSISGTPTKTITTYNERFQYELDLKNLQKSGREWYGEEFNSYNLSREFTFPVTNLVANSNISVTSSVLGVSAVTGIGGRFTLTLNGAALGTQVTQGHGGQSYHDAGNSDEQTFSINSNNVPFNPNELKVNIQFNQMGQPSAYGHLNFLEVNARRQLVFSGTQTPFRTFENLGANAISQFQVANVQNPNTYIWDVTDPTQPVQQDITVSNGQATFIAKTDTIREFTVFSGSISEIPNHFGRVPNQNLHTLNSNGKLDLVIISHPLFLDQSNQLANHRRQHDKLKVAVVTTKQVFNEFAAGAGDPTGIRDFMKMIYERKNQLHTKTADSLIYLLLMGDASYDYKSKFATASQNRTPNNTNFVPVYESRESLNAVYTYSSEDYYGLLDDTEGNWFEGSVQQELLDLGIGRIPAHSYNDATIMVNKIIHYDNPDHFGKWRNQISFAADDEDGKMHLDQAEIVADILERKYPEYNARRIYLDMFKQVAVPNGQRSPDCVAAIDQAVEQGSLIVNYTGHGGETGLAGEQIVTVNQINSWNNYNKPTFLVTATCEFGRYDDPERSSAAEHSILNPNGGAVGLLTTTRPVNSGSNGVLNAAFFNCAFEPINGRMPRLGDIMNRTKNNSLDKGNRNFAILCDPTLRLAYPQEKVTVTSLQVAGQLTDTLKALATVTLNGAVTNGQQTLTNFNGKVQITVFEKTTLVRTLGDNGSIPTNVRIRENIIYNGVATAQNGLFHSTFVVPKDIAYNYGRGKISLYASQDSYDAHGANSTIQIGGSAPNVALDSVPPSIQLFMDNESFVFGGLTGSNSMLIANLSDSSGINTAGIGIGHEITATLDGNKENVKVLNEYFTSEADNYQAGTVRFMFKNLSKGPHELRIKAWDNHNNSAEKRIEFVVASSEGLALDHVLNYPNPFSTNTTFHFDHNRAGDDLDIQIQIFTVTGKLIKTLSATSLGSKPHISEISWNGRDEFNDVLAKGVYIYKLNVRSVRDGAKVSKYEKMVILN